MGYYMSSLEMAQKIGEPHRWVVQEINNSLEEEKLDGFGLAYDKRLAGYIFDKKTSGLVLKILSSKRVNMREQKRKNTVNMREPKYEKVETEDLPEVINAIFDAIKEELSRSGRKYRAEFVSSKEALGVITEEYEEVKECLRELKLTDGLVYNRDFPDLSDRLEVEGVQLAAMAVKMIYSCCGVANDADK